MKLKKRILSTALAGSMIFGSALTFAADLDVKNIKTNEITTSGDYLFDDAKFSNIIFGLNDYLIEVDGQYYSAKQVSDATEDKTPLKEAVKNLTPVAEVAPVVIESVDVSVNEGRVATITAVIKNSEAEDTATVTIKPDSSLGLEDIVIENVTIDGNGNLSQNAGPLPVGNHVATVTVGGASKSVDFTVVEEDALKVESVSAINSTQAEVTFSKEVKEVKPANFKVTDKDGNLVFVSKIELNEAKTAATLTFFSKFADKATYTVETSNVADVDGNVMTADTDAFTYLAAKVAKVEFTSTTIAPSTDLRTIVKVTDELGRDVTSEQSIDFESSNTVSVGADGKATSTPGSAIVVAKVGDVKTAPTTIKVSAKVATAFTGFNVYTGSNTVADTDAFEKLEADKKVEYVYADDTSSKLALYYKDQYGKSITAVDRGLSVTNMTPSVVIVNADGTITPISAGEGYVKVKANADLEHTIKIVVREKAEVATMELEKTDVSVVEGQNATVKVTFKDQFNTKVSKTPTVKPAATATATSVAGTDSVVVNGVKEGTTTVDVTYKVGETTLKQTINVTVVKAADLATYQAEVAATKLDVDGNNTDSTKLPTFTNVVVNEIDANGNKIGTTAATLKEVDKDGKDLAAGKDLVTIADQKVTAKAAGTAYVQVKVGSLVIDTLEFEVVKTASYANSVDFTRNDIVLSEQKTTAGNGVNIDLDTELKKIVQLLDQNGKVMVDVEGNAITADSVTFTVTNANGLKIGNDGKKITTLSKEVGTADLVLTEVKVTENDKNLLSTPTVIKVSVKQNVKELDGEAVKEVTVESFNGKFLVAGLVADGTEGPQVASDLNAVKTFIDNKYNVNFNKDAITIGEDGKVSITGTILSTSDWYKVKENGNNDMPYRITLDGTSKKVKIAMYADGTATIEDTRE